MTADGLKKVKPINTKRYDGSVYRDKYTFGSVHVNDIPRGFQQKGVDFQKGKDNIRWEYKDKCPVLIRRDGVYAKEDADTEEAQNQAYFALSILADEGYVSAWKKL